MKQPLTALELRKREREALPDWQRAWQMWTKLQQSCEEAVAKRLEELTEEYKRKDHPHDPGSSKR